MSYYDQLYFMGMGVSLPEKIEIAIATLKHYEAEALKFDPNGYWLCDSYGKDSCVILHLAKRAGVKFVAHHNLTTIDPPELIYFGRKHHADTIVHRPVKSLFRMMVDDMHMPPSRVARWCCKEYKESSHGNAVAVFGIRAEESANRAKRWKIWTPYRGGSWVLNPILYWSADNVWQYIRENNIPYCSLYDEGFDRLGCIGCPMGRKKQRLQQFARWPRYEALWKKAFREIWESYHGKLTVRGEARGMDKHNFNSWEDYFNWWVSDEPGKKDDECQVGLF